MAKPDTSRPDALSGDVAEWNAHELMARTVIGAIQTCQTDALIALRSRRRVEIRTWSSSLVALLSLSKPLIKAKTDNDYKTLTSALWRVYRNIDMTLEGKLSDLELLSRTQGQAISAIQKSGFLFSIGHRTKTGTDILERDLDNLGLKIS